MCLHRIWSVATALLLATAAVASDQPAVVYLNGPQALAQLQERNPAHYARAARIIAAANVLCRPGLPESITSRFEASDLSCADANLKTSNPPKRQLSFVLDTTRYVALVAITDDPPKVEPLEN